MQMFSSRSVQQWIKRSNLTAEPSAEEDTQKRRLNQKSQFRASVLGVAKFDMFCVMPLGPVSIRGDVLRCTLRDGLELCAKVGDGVNR